MSNLLVEVVIRKNDKDIIKKIPENMNSYLVFESGDKLVYNVPIDWSGFKDGTIMDMLKKFGESMYLALAYFSIGDNEFITDFEGKLLDQYDSVFEGRKASKYVKKRMQILKILDDSNDVFEVKRYILDLKFTNPVMKVMDLYSDASNGGISSKEFLK